MLKIHRNAPSAMASFNRLLTAARASHFGKTGFPSILASRRFCHRATFATSLHASPISAARLVETASRAYATTTTKRKTTAKKTATPKKPAAKKKTATKKKTAAKKKTATKKAKKPKKKVVKKAKKTPAKVSKPKVITLPSPRPVSGYVLFIRDVMSGNTIPMTEASAQWKAISDPEKEVPPTLRPRPYDTRLYVIDADSRPGTPAHRQKALIASANSTKHLPSYHPPKSERRTKRGAFLRGSTARPRLRQRRSSSKILKHRRDLGRLTYAMQSSITLVEHQF